MSERSRFVSIFLLGCVYLCANISPTLSQQPAQNYHNVTYTYLVNGGPGVEKGADAGIPLNSTSQQTYIIYNRDINQQQQTQTQQTPNVAYAVNQPQGNRQNQPQPPAATQYTQFLAQQQQKAGVGPQQSQKLFNRPYPNQQQQQPQQHPYVQQINRNTDNNNNRPQLIANGNSLSTVPVPSSTALPSASPSSPVASLPPSDSNQPFKPLLPFDFDDIINGDDEKSSPSPTRQCLMCCTASEMLPCSSSGCCEFSPFLNLQTLKSTVG